MKNNYGNYVVQSALKLARKNQKEILINNMLKNIDKMKDKKLINKWKVIIDTSLGISKHRQDKKSGSDKLPNSNDSKVFKSMPLDANSFNSKDYYNDQERYSGRKDKKHYSDVGVDYSLENLSLNDKYNYDNYDHDYYEEK